MDERHWWIATKVQETFRVGGNDSLTELEELFLQADNLQLIDTFLKAEGLAKLFFFANTESQEELQPCDLNIGENLDNVIDSRNTAILYFLRHKTDRDVDPIRMEQDIFCGEIKHNLVDSLISQLSEIYIPLFRAQEDWGSCTQDDVRHFLLGLDRYVSALQDSAGAAVRSEKQQILKRPAQIVSSDIMQQRSVPVDSDVVSENEALVSDWMKTIEQVLNEGGDDRVLDINTTPLTELDRWQRRQRSLESITEQLKGKECRNVIGLLISTKSRLLKKWKAVDISITDVANDTKSRVKYLEALHRHFDALASENNPVNLMNTVLPGIVNTIKQIDAMSRFFSRNAYLGLLLTKVGNQLTLACREFLKEGLVLGNSEDRLWDRIREEMERGYLLPLQAVSHPKNKGKERKPEQTINTNTLYDRVQACLMLQACFLDTVRQLREALGGSHGLPLFSSSSSLSTMQGKLTSFSTGRVTKASLRKTSLTSSCLDHSHDYQGLGVPLTDEETIMHNLDLLCCKLRQFSNVIVALQQYKTLLDQTRGLQKPSYEDLSVNDLGDGESIHELTVEDHIDSLRAEIKLYSTEPCRTGLSVAPLQTLIEEDEVQSATGLPILALHHQSESKRLVPLEETSDPQQLRSEEEEEEEEEEAVNTLSYEEKLMLRNLYNWNDPEDEGCSLSSIISDYLNNMINTMASAVRTEVLLGVEKRDLDTFEDVYSEFLVMNQQLERYLSIYIQALFLRRMHTQEALSILKRFSVVGQRQGIQPVINECYVEALEWFYEEIKEVQETYEEQKDDPVLPRNLPPAAGAIYWSRQLLSKIEEPMKIFREVRVITTSNSYIQTVRLYNRIAAALVAYETLWYQEWRSQADRCLDGLNATLLIRDPDTQELMVNCDPRIIQLFEETKWMVRFKLQVPQAVMLALKQEKKFKMYKSRLQGILQEYQCVKKTVPECLAVQFAAQLEYVNRHFQPGLSLLAWNSVDIEAFLHHVYKDITRLRAVVEKAAQIKETVIDKALEAIQNLELFSADKVLSESRSPTEFLQLIRSSLQKNQAELEQIVKTIKTAISDLRFSIKNAKDGSLGVSQDSAPLKPLNKHSHSRLRQALSQARQHASLSIAAGGSNSYEESDSQVLEYFCSQTGKAVFACVCRSLLVLAQVTGCDMERIIAEVSLNHQEEVHTGSSATASDTGTNTASEVSSSSIIRSTISEVMMDQKSHLRCSLKLRLTIPTIVIDPTCEVAQDAVNEAASAVLDLTDCVNWGPGETQEGTLISTIREDKTIQHILRHINHVIISLKPTIEKHIFHYSYYDFLWKDDMNCQYTELTSVNCELLVINKVVERIHKIEQKIQDFSPVFQVGCLWLDSSVIRDTLKGFAGVWKFKYSSVLHQDVKKRLDTVVQYRDACYQQLTIQVQSLEQLNKALCLLEEIEDMENKIHGIYQPIESTYTQLRSYHLRIPREEATEVDNLWENWTELIVLAENVKRHLLKDKKDVFEQELDKQVKSFGVDVIQFRNSFDTQGPAAPGLKPEEAVHQLQEFQEKFKVYDAKKKTLNSLQRLFGITPKAFLELDRTGKDLQLLGTLYELFQKFLSFDQRFRDTLWAEVNLKQSNAEVMDYWSQCQSWNDRLTNWDAYDKMAWNFKFYVDCFPILHSLAAKEIRNRHWLQVMTVTGSSFPLEATVFKLHHLLGIELLKHQKEINSIATAASEELKLEVKMRTIEEEWTEQVLSFEAHRNRGPLLLVKEDSVHMLEQVEDARLLLAHMLTSKHIGPLREEAASWSEKLKEVGAVLELWLEVQDLWQNLESVFSDPNIAKELPQDAKRFAKVERNWIKMMRSANNTKNVLQCCCAEELPKEVVLRNMYKELEICCQSLTSFLDRRRQAFPRFYFLPDLVLLSFLSHPTDIGSLQKHFGLIFGGVHNVELERMDGWEGSNSCVSELVETLQIPGVTDRLGSSSQQSFTHMTDTDSILPKSIRSAGVSMGSPLPASGREPNRAMQAVSVIAEDGEHLQLDEEVPISLAVEEWLTDLQCAIFRTLESCINKAAMDISQGVSIDEWTYRNPFQIARLGLLYCWTRDCEAAITDFKSDRKALPGALKKYAGMIFRLSTIISKGTWRHNDESVTYSQKLKLENMVMFAVYLREVMESLNAHKVREVTDFEWRRALRFYWHETDGSNSHNLCIHDAQYESGHEFYGAAVPVTMNPITEKSFLSLSHIIQKTSGAVVLGDHGTGKTETVKGFAHLLGKFLLLFNCSSYTDPATITAVQHGAARDGCWVGFDDFHLLTKQSVSTFMFGAQTLYDNLKAKLNTCILGDGKEITLNRNVALLLTVHCKSEYKKLPSDVLALFRTVSLTAPDQNVILRANLTAFGFKSPKMLAHRLQLVTELVKDQLPEKVHHHLSLSSLVPVLKRAAQKKEAGREERADGRHDRLEIRNEGERTSRSSSITSTQPFSGSAMSLSPSLKTVPSTDRKTRAVSNNAMTTAARLDHALVGETLLECIAPRMEGDDLSVFNQIVRDIFGVLLDLSSPNGYLQSPQNCIDNAILTSAKDKNLIPHAPWVNKVKQLYSLSQVHHGIIVAGPPGAGKSSCISTLVQALSLLPAGRQQQQAGSPVVMRNEPIRHRLVKFNPLAVDEFTLLFGSQLPSQNWEDGIITSAWRKAIRNCSNTWLCFDGPLTSSWVDNFNSVLGQEKVLQLSNGEHLKITSNMQLLFETSELELASPASISRAGILYIDSKITGWRPLAKAWLAGRNEQENIVLSEAFNTALDPVFNYILRDIKSPVPLTEVGLFQTITNLLGAMLHEKAQSLGGPLHIERLFLFCLIWTVGGLLGRSDKKRFSDILKSHTSTLPDYDDEVSVFNYYVDESGEWDLWQSRISEHNRTRQTDILGEVFVETVDTLAVRTFMEYADMASQNVLLVGSPGSGKTALINDFIYAQDKSHTLVKRMVFSGASKAKNLQKMFEESTIHRQGFVYGAREGKTLQIFIDDISLPESQCCGELLRQVLDDKVLVKHSKPFEWRQIEALVVQAAMSLPEYPSDSTHSISQRLLRHFAVLNLPFPEGSKLSQVIFSILQANMMKNDGQQLEGNLHNVLVSASCSILESIKRSLRPSADQGRQHYLFSLREIARVFQCLCNLSYERREDTFMVLCFWKHEMRHVVGDRLCQYADLNWFHDQLENIIEQHVPGSHHDSSHEHIVTFPIDEKITKQQSAWNSDKGVQVQLQTVRGIDAVHGCLQAYLKQYNGELGNQPLDIKLSENTLTHVVRIHRVLAYRHSGNLVIVNSPGSHLRTLLKLALYIADIPLQRVDTSQKAHFFNSLKSAVRHAATDRKVAALLLTARELGDDSYLDAINSILISGEYAPLFSREEMHDLLQIINPALQKEHPHLAHDPVSYIASRVKSSLRVIVCLPPNHVLLKTDSVKYPGFLSCCHIIWICDWTQEAVFHETAHYLSECNILEKHSEEIRKQVAGTMASIHCQMLKECQQVPWAGSCDPTLTLNTVTLQKTENDGKETVRTEPVTVPNMPYSKAIVKERIELMDNNGLAPAVYSKVFCGQSTLRQYLDTFKHIYICKCTEQEKTEALLGKSLETLAQTRADARTTQDSIRNLTEQFEEAKTTASDLLERLTSRTSALESLKGQLGIGAASLQAFLAQIESESEEIELDALLKDDDYDEYDKAFYEMKELRSKSHVNKLTEDLEKAKNELEEARNSLSHAKNQVMHWCNKVDKSCIERISRCQNPPFLLAQVLEMVLVMMDLIPNPSDTDLETSRTNRHSNDLSEGRHYQKSVTSRSARNSKMWSTRGGTGKDGKDKVDKTWWKTLQNYVGDIGKFVDMIHNVARLEDGLPGEVLKLVESYLGKTKEGSLGVTGEGSLLENAAPHATPQSITPAKKFTVVDSSVRKGGITIAAARYCSEEAATLVAFVVALVEYTRLCGPLRACLSRVQELEVEKEDNEWKDQEIQKSGESEEKDLLDAEPEKPVFTADELPILQSEVQQLQSEYDVAVANKHKIETELHSNKERLRAAQDVLKSLSTLEQQWKEALELCVVSELLTNCLLAAAFLTYCGPFNAGGRLMGCELFLLKCEEGGLPLPQKVLFRQMTLMQFMHNPIEIQKLQMKGPALNKNTQTISCIFKRKGCIGTWVLLCDPTAQSIEWVKNHFLPDCMEVKYHELQSQLDCCLTEGIPLLLTYCDLQSLTTDQRFAQVLRSQLEFERNTSPFKITVADHEVECHPGFRLVLHTPGLPEEVPPEVAAFCSTAYFYQDREGLAEQLLDRFVQLEKTRLGEEYTTLQQECLENMEDLRDVEMKIAQTLSSDCTLLSSLAINKKLSDLKQHYDEARETRARLSLSEKTALTAREGFRDIALRGGIMFDTANALRQLNSTYHISYNQLLEVFDASVAHSERHTIKAIVDRLTYNIFCYVGTYLLERDRMVYSLLLAFEIEGCLGRIDPGEMEFILSPELCAVVMQGMGAEGSGARHHSKNPFDWMTEDQFKNVQILAMYYSWFWDLFDRMYKDGKEMTWKALCDSDQPETPTKGKCPEGLDELSPLQRLLVVRAVRSDRLTHAASIFISSALGKRYTAEIPFDLQNCLQQSKPQSLILLQFSAEGDAPRRLVLELAHRRSCRTQVLSVINCSVNEGRRIKHLIEQGMAEGNWVLLENIHNSAHLMTSLEGILNVNKSPDRNFRLWVSASTSSNLPVRLLHISHRIIVDQPKNMKDGMLRCLQGVDSEALKTSSRPEWPAVVHNLCFLHSAVRLRAASGGAMGWNSRDTMMFGNQQFMDALQVLTEEFRDRDPEAEGRGVSWTGIRYLLSEVIYGSNIIDESDRISLASLVDLWISSTATKKDCDLTKLKYRVPAAFFIPGTQLSSLLQALDSVPRNSLDVPEAVSMHSASELHFGDEEYVCSWLYSLNQSLLPSDHQQHSLTPQYSPSNTAININLPLVATQGNHSLIQLKPSKEPELWEICYNILAKLPKGWTKDFISERLKKIGGNTPFNLFIKKELNHLMGVLSEVRRNLQAIKSSTESLSMFGGRLSEMELCVARDLYQQRAPQHWSCLAGRAFPLTQGHTAWISDLQLRVSHFEKILLLGQEKMPTYWLGAFRNPKGLLGVFRQQSAKQHAERTGSIEPMVFQTVITQRDKEHMRDPPQEGMFVYGIYLWGVSWHKTEAELLDAPPRRGPVPLPVIHLHCMPRAEKASLAEAIRTTDTYQCPVYTSSKGPREPVLHLDIHKESVPATRWALRGMKATLQPF
ncbi:dynein axonemal heavy chain 8-like [Acipenser ruthenus]|uniref:dynein axonemal heavy chain 8-like n=1 Tax=Acipenser ruthenus TaxID=7906 RepID=UPI00274250D8|nr:dynein axonemal heavy chain 8-like [Acipenser ruthenus]